MRPWISYSIIRIGLFAALLVLLLLAGVPWYFAAVAAAVVGFSISYIFFTQLRDRVALDLAARRSAPGKRVPASRDEDEEDATLEG